MSIEPYTGSSRNRVTHHQGFTLVELMVTVAIVAILATIAYPSYQQYVLRSNRSLAQQIMLDIANREEEYLLNNRRYGNLTDLGITLPGQLTRLYSITATPQNSAAPIGYQITATPNIGTSQSIDGALTLDHLGNRTPIDKW